MDTKRVTTKFRKLFKINPKERIYLFTSKEEKERKGGSPLWAHDTMTPG